jgi:hypothetical protein
MQYSFHQNYQLTKEDIKAIKKAKRLGLCLNHYAYLHGPSYAKFFVEGKNYDGSALQQEYIVKTEYGIDDSTIQSYDEFDEKTYHGSKVIYNFEFHPLKAIVKPGHIINVIWHKHFHPTIPDVIQNYIFLEICEWKTSKEGWKSQDLKYRTLISSDCFKTSNQYKMLMNDIEHYFVHGQDAQRQ